MAKRNPLLQKLLCVSRWKLKYKILAIVLLSAVLIMLMALFGMYRISSAYNQVIYNTLADSLSFSTSEMTYRLNSVKTQALSISENATVQTNLAKLKDSARTSASDHNQVYYALQTFYTTNRRNHVSNISIYTDRYTFSTNSSKTVELPQEVYETLRNRALEHEGGTRLVTDFSQEHGLFFIKEIRRISNLRLDTLGVLVIHMDLAGLVTSSGALSQYDELLYVLLDTETGTVMYDPGQLARGGERELLEGIPFWQIVQLSGQRYFATSDINTAYGWKSVCLVPYEAVFNSISRAVLLVVAVFAAGLGITFLISRGLTSSITRHLSVLTRRMDQFAKYTPDMPLESARLPATDDEIRRIYRHFDSMTREIDELITKDYTNQILMKDAQLKALRMQINPHFLYNTLSTVNWKARMIGAEDISIMVLSLSQLLQATLKEDTGLITLAEDLSLVNTYLTIQKYRFEERLAYTQIVPEELEDALIPKLALQPIVENAITYGMEQVTGACQIFLTARRCGDDILITVQNDGSCFEPDLLARLQGGAAVPKGHGTGLVNIQKRLELAFGSQARLRLYNLGDMATAEIRVPYQIS